MGLEIVVCALLSAFFFGGVVAPITLWVVVSVMQRRRLVEGLYLSGVKQIEDAGDEDAEAPVRLVLHGAHERRLVVAALTRGQQHVWQVRVPVERAPSPPFSLAREGAARRLSELRDLPVVEPLPGAPWGFRLSTEDRERLAHDLGARLPAAAARLMSGAESLVQAAFTGEHVVVELAREELTSDALLRALRRSWRFAEAIGAVRGPLRFADEERPHSLVASSGSGAPLALPS